MAHSCLSYFIDTPVSSYPLKLVGGAFTKEGRLEIMFRGEWGVVCGDSWTLSNSVGEVRGNRAKEDVL